MRSFLYRYWHHETRDAKLVDLFAFGIIIVVLVMACVITSRANGQPPHVSPSALIKVPVTGAAWVPPDQQAQQASSVEQRLQQLEAKIDKILKLLEEAGGPDPAGAQVAAPPQALLDALGTCVQCHADRVARQKGDGFVLFLTRKDEDGKEQSLFRDDLDKRELRRVQQEVTDGLMPKKTGGKTLTPEQKAALLSEVKSAIARKDSESR